MYVLHYAPDNASLIIRLAMLEAGVAFRTALVNRAAQAQNSPAYRKLNPTGLVPVLETPEGPIAETGAILLWLAERHGAGLLPPGNRGDVLKWLFFLSNTAHAEIRHLFYPDRYVDASGQAGHFQRMSARMQTHFGILDQTAKQSPDLFAPPSILGIYLAALLRWSVLYTPSGWFDLESYPALARLARMMDARASTAALILAEGMDPSPFAAPLPCHPAEGSPL